MYRTEAQITAQLRELEMVDDLLRFRVAGWSVWPLLRFTTARALQHLPQDRGRAVLSSKQLRAVAARDAARWLFLKDSEIIAKSYSSNHSEQVNGLKWDMFVDPVLSAAPSYCKLLSVNSRAFIEDRTPYGVPATLTSVPFDAIGDRLGRKRPVEEARRVAAEMAPVLGRRFGKELYSVESLTRTISSFVWTKRLYGLLLRRLRPKVLLLEDSGDYPVTAAARELGIRIAEFQHGLMDRHITATSWGPHARERKDTIPLPDRILLFGEHWRQELAVDGFWGEELRVVGSARVDAYRNLPRPAREGVCRLVFTAQSVDSERIAAFLAEFLELARHRVEVELSIKLHPAYDFVECPFEPLLGRNAAVRIIKGSDTPGTLEMIAQAHMHISVYSMCHYEALALGVPTIILPMTGAENVEHLRASKHAFAPTNPAELVDIVAGWKGHTVAEAVGDAYFAEGAQQKVLSELRDLGGVPC